MFPFLEHEENVEPCQVQYRKLEKPQNTQYESYPQIHPENVVYVIPVVVEKNVVCREKIKQEDKLLDKFPGRIPYHQDSQK